jgi:sugar/nucleoside kinase (ribokinase family)
MMGNQRPRAFGAGLVALDIVISADAEAPMRSYAGGTCGNVMAALAYLGWESFPVARLNEDPAALRVRHDLERWGVRLDYASCRPPADTPIIIQEIRRGRDGAPTHRFSWACPKCGQWLPGFKAVTRVAIEAVADSLPGSTVFFMDRLSRASLTLAAEAARLGAVVVLEPSAKGDSRLMAEALKLAHVVKYADSRLEMLEGVMARNTATLLEIQTLGSEGLRYRERLGGSPGQWRTLDAVWAPRLADSCGSGDWCTAGLISRLASGRAEGLMNADRDIVEDALRYGQTLAAWNCGFEGARGGMYACEPIHFEAQVAAIGRGSAEFPAQTTQREDVVTDPGCPACAPVATQEVHAAVPM